MSLLKCGCELTIEGGYGDDGSHSRDTIEWCKTHGAAGRMATLLQAALAEHDRRHFAPFSDCHPGAQCAAWPHDARLLLASVDAKHTEATP